MDEPPSSSSSSSSSSSPPPSSAAVHIDVGAVASSSSASHVREEEEEDDHNQYHLHHNFRQPEPEVNEIGASYRAGGAGGLTGFDEAASVIRDDTWSCIIVLFTFWFFVSMTLILGVYGSETLELGPATSILLQPNPLFVQSIKVEELNISTPGPVLYGFYNIPSLSTVASWSESHDATVTADSHKEWIFYLNKGSQISISYNVSLPSTSIFLIIAQGQEGLAQWLEEPTYPNTTLSWSLVHGSGKIQQDISTSYSYYISVGNMNYEDVEVQLNFTLNALLYDTTEAYYKCTFTDTSCSLNVLFPSGNVGVLASPGPEQSTYNQYVKLSYGPRWATYIIGIGGMTVLMLLAFNFLNKYRGNNEDGTRVQQEAFRPERAPLLSYKDDDQSSWGSSYDSASNDEGDLEDLIAAGSLEGEGNNTRRLCAICFDAPRDCFFLPCGHCPACFDCATRIAEADATCPMCRRNIRKVRKIFTV